MNTFDNYNNCVCNHVKLEIRSFVMNFNSGAGGFLQGYYTVGTRTVWWILAMGLADLWGIADLICIAERSKVPNG